MQLNLKHFSTLTDEGTWNSQRREKPDVEGYARVISAFPNHISVILNEVFTNEC